MPLRCVDPLAGRGIYASDFNSDEWGALARANREARHLVLPCCSSRVTLKRSSRGTQFFAHATGTNCATALETEVHRQLKRMAIEAARANDWQAETEVSGVTPQGEQWKADVLARKGAHKIAIEVQWSAQTNEETRRRQQRYAQAGVRCLWLLRRSGGLSDYAVPEARIRGNLDNGFTAVVGASARPQELPMSEFLDAAFGGRLRFGVPTGTDAAVSIRIGTLDCWSCGAETPLVTWIEFEFGPNKCSLTVPDLDKWPDVLDLIQAQLAGRELSNIKRRYSRAQGRAYVSNGCLHCDSLMGEFFEHDAWDDDKSIPRFSVPITTRLREVIEGSDSYTADWAVYPKSL